MSTLWHGWDSTHFWEEDPETLSLGHLAKIREIVGSRADAKPGLSGFEAQAPSISHTAAL